MSLPANVRVNAQLPFPSLIRGMGPITIGKANGIWQIGFTINAFGSQNPPVANYATDYLLGYDAVAQSFFKIALAALAPPGGQAYFVTAKAVNFNAANTDTPIAIPLPPGVTNYQIANLRIANASASISTATFGLFQAAGGSGAIIAGGTAITVTSAAANTNNNSMLVAPGNAATQSFNLGSVFFRVGTAQGSAA